MANLRFSSSGAHQDIAKIAIDQVDTEASIRFYFLSAQSLQTPRFLGYTVDEVMGEMQALIDEHGLRGSMQVLAALEAEFRLDYLIRVRDRLRDPLSRHLRAIYKEKEEKAALEDDILEAWKTHSPAPGISAVVSDLKGAFKYRHWLAHGRYWIPKLGRKYDYVSLWELAQTVDSSFGLLRPTE